MTKEQLLLEAVRAGDLPSIQRSIAEGADVNSLVDGMFRVVAHPGGGDRVAVVRHFLENGADPLPAEDQASALAHRLPHRSRQSWGVGGNASRDPVRR